MPWAERMPSGRWRAVWRDPQRQRQSLASFSHKSAAVRYAGEQEGKSRRGEASHSGRTIAWGAWCDQWLELRRVERTSTESDGYRLEKWLRPRWGDIPMGRIDPEDVQLWVNDLSGAMAAASVEKTYRLLATSLTAAVKHGRLAVSPCRGVQLPRVPPPDERFLTRAEFWQVAELLNPPYRQVAIILVGTGMRFGELAGLHHARVDWIAEAVDVHEVWDGQRIKAYPKGRRKRRVPMPSWVATAIADLGGSEVKGCGLLHDRGSRCTSGLVVTGPHGAPLNARNVLRRHWGPAVARAGLDHARQHDLRHTYASWLAQAGRSMTEIAELLGHSETTVTARYAHLAGTHMDGVRGVLEN